MSPICLNAVAVSKTYDSGLIFKKYRKVLDGVSLEIEEGKTFGLVGPSGSGKTTLGRIMAGLDRPSKGDVLFHGKNIAKMDRAGRSHFRRRVQVVFQDPEGSLNPRKRIETAFDEVLSLVKVPKKAREERTLAILDAVGLSEDLLCRYPNQLSGGQNQRVVIGRVLLLDPEFIILDEPTSALDISVQAQILNMLKDLQKQRGIGYLLISHDVAVVKFMAQDVGVMKEGRLVFG